MKKQPHIAGMFSAEYSVLRRLFLLCALTFATFFLLQTKKVTILIGVPSFLPQGFNAFPLLLIFFCCLFFFRKEKSHFPKKLPWPDMSQLLIAVLFWITAMHFATWITRPPYWLGYYYEYLTQTYKETGVSFLVAGLYSSLLLSPLVAYTFLLFPLAFLQTFRRYFLGGLLLLLLYIFASIAEYFYHLLTVQTVLRLSAAFMQIFSPDVVLRADKWEIGYGEYLALVGPLCSGFSIFVLFIGMFAYMWSQQATKLRKDSKRGFLILAGGLILLFGLNIVRIAGLVMLGSVAPAFATQLIHGVGSGVLLLGVGWGYLRLLLGRSAHL